MLQWCGDMGVTDWVSMIALWATVLGVTVWAVLRLFPTQPGSHARNVLDQRLAHGEIDLETYRSARAAMDLSDPELRQAGPLRGA